MTIVTEQGLNGEKLLRSQRTLNGPPGMIVRMGTAPSGDAEAQAIRNAHAELARTALAFLLASPASLPLEFSAGGEAESDEGKADVLDAKGGGNFATRILLDQKSHRPLMLMYRGVAPRVMIQTQQGPPPPDGGRAEPPHDAPTASAPQVVDITLYLDDYKAVDGVMLPHHMARSVDGKPTEDTTFKTIKINPAFITYMVAAGPAVAIDGLVMRYGEKVAVDDLSLSVGRATITAVLGPNGAGKTTTLETAEGYRSPQSGRVRVLGLDPVRDRRALLPRIGVMLQGGGAWSGVRADEMLRHVARLHAHPLDLGALSERLGLGECGRTPYRRLSGGQQQRLGLAMAIVGRPEIVFVDEPTAGMDPAGRRTTWALLQELRAAGVAVVLTTHYMEEAEQLCDRVGIMDHGHILEMGTVDELISGRFKELSVRFDAVPGLEHARLTAMPGVARVVEESGTATLYTTDVAATIGALLEATAQLGAEPRNLNVRRATLEDVFLDLTGRALRD